MKSVVSTQAVIALSSGDAECAANVKGASVGLGTKSLMIDLGASKQTVLNIHTDSAASKGICSRRGIGRIRHLHTPMLWIQQRAAAKDLFVKKTDGKNNAADLGTKEMGRPDMERHLATCGFVFTEGKHPLALSSQAAGPGDFGLSGYDGNLGQVTLGAIGVGGLLGRAVASGRRSPKCSTGTATWTSSWPWIPRSTTCWCCSLERPECRNIQAVISRARRGPLAHAELEEGCYCSHPFP